jgi:hypothetical protein
MEMGNAEKIFRAATFVVAIIVLVPIIYFGAYFSTGTLVVGTKGEGRCFRYEWQARLFVPASRIESYLRQKEVGIGWDGS